MKEDYFVIVDHEALETFLTQVYQKVDIPQGDAVLLAHSLVESNLRGNDSHGVLLAYPYFSRLKAGNTNPKYESRIISDRGATAVLDGGNSIGQVVSHHAMQLAIEKADQYGVGIVGARHSNHYAAAGYWSMMALEHDMIGMTSTNTSPLMAPFGGSTAVLGSSPISVAIPAGQERPVVLDMATTMVAGGKFRIASMREEKVPLDWALGPDNKPTDDPNDALKGRIQPIGGTNSYKGYGLALVFDILSAVLMGASFGTQVSLASTKPRDIGHFFQAIKVANFMPVDAFKARVDTLIQELKASELEPGVEQVFYAGEKEHLMKEERLANGIPLDGPVYDNLEKMSEEVEIPLNIRIS